MIADEPTTALDVTVQAQILAELGYLKNELGSGVVLITHDLGVVAEMADEAAVMYAGSIVEHGGVLDVFENPGHPYTRALLKSIPRLGDGGDTLDPVRGRPPSLLELPDRCVFLPRCDQAGEMCLGKMPELTAISPGHRVACRFGGQRPEV
ncbi:MAG: hypothetical protein K6T66_14860 [Peptococcaceae bacterium]|nr:hypothetical protein [Peptococcaceae bacterium]